MCVAAVAAAVLQPREMALAILSLKCHDTTIDSIVESGVVFRPGDARGDLARQ